MGALEIPPFLPQIPDTLKGFSRSRGRMVAARQCLQSGTDASTKGAVISFARPVEMDRLLSRTHRIIALTTLLASLTAPAGAADWDGSIRVGNLVDYSGRTSVLGRKYGQGKEDAVAYINYHGGVRGLMIDLLTMDYAYVLPQAVNAYNTWMRDGGVAAIQGWGMADVRGLGELVARDHIPYFSASFRTGLAGEDAAAEETNDSYHFFVGPGAVDGLYALLDWAAHDWQSTGQTGQPLYVHMGDGSDFAVLGRAPGEERAKQLGFQVYAPLRYGTPEDNKAACQALAAEGIDYAYLADTGDSNAPLIRTCRDMGVTTRFMTNIWGFDEQMLQSLGMAGDGVVWVMATAAWGENVPGMRLLRDIAAFNGDTGPKSIHYIQGVCSVYFMKDAMDRATLMPGGVTPENVRAAMEEPTGWAPLGLEGACNPGTWTAGAHRGISDIWIYMAHMAEDGYNLERVYTASLSQPVPKAEEAPAPAPPEANR